MPLYPVGTQPGTTWSNERKKRKLGAGVHACDPSSSGGSEFKASLSKLSEALSNSARPGHYAKRKKG